jgi:hypothetical protein
MALTQNRSWTTTWHGSPSVGTDACFSWNPPFVVTDSGGERLSHVDRKLIVID